MTVVAWQQMTPEEVLATYPALTMTQVAYVLNLTFVRGERKGEPDRRKAINLVDAGRIPVIDPQLPTPYWTVSSANIRRYLDGDTAEQSPTARRTAANDRPHHPAEARSATGGRVVRPATTLPSHTPKDAR